MRIALTGSSRFGRWFRVWKDAFELVGHNVTIGHDTIKDCDALVVLNVYAYLGEQTLADIKRAKKIKTPIFFLESWGVGCGIGPNHYDHVVKAAKSLSIENYGSPLDTSKESGIWDSELVGPAGYKRSKIVSMVEALRPSDHI